MDPLNGVIEFPKKVITSTENVFPEHKFIKLSNPSSEKSIMWRIDTSDLDKDNIFIVMPSSGMINPKATMSVKIQFKPTKSKKYNITLPIYIEKEEVPYNQLILKAEGSAPYLLFETTDIILPTVPLNMESSSRFVIINDGYIKTNLKYTITRHIQDTNLKVTFVNGNHLNSSKNLCIIEISFIAKNPVSFMTRIDFEDNNKKAYSIMVSGTSDNFLFSTFFPGMSKNFSLKKSERNKMELYGLGIFQSKPTPLTNNKMKRPNPKRAKRIKYRSRSPRDKTRKLNPNPPRNPQTGDMIWTLICPFKQPR